jgi:outer membrane protein TolC
VDELSAEAVVEQMLARNPTLAQMVAAWEAASARYPQVTSLDDPVFGATLGPASIGSRDVDFAYRVEISQRYPWPGKRGLRGENARAEASAARGDVEDTRLRLIQSARDAFYEYYLVTRALAVNEEALRLLKEFRENALTRFRNKQAPEQDFRQADIEIGRQRERQLTLERMRQVAIARINTLMHLPTGNPLPPPPEEVRLADSLPDPGQLQADAVARRPDLRALADRVAAERAALALACKEFYPDFEVMAAYDAFWQPPERDLRPMLGVRLNLPVRTQRRYGAVTEAEARLAGRVAELTALTDQVNFEVQQAYEQARESERAVRLYEETILPAARENVKAALTAYTTNQVPFLSLIEALRNLVALRDRYYETLSDAFRRRAALERAVGGPADRGSHKPEARAKAAGSLAGASGLCPGAHKGSCPAALTPVAPAAAASASTPAPGSRGMAPAGR